jgi:hypothetical protein
VISTALLAPEQSNTQPTLSCKRCTVQFRVLLGIQAFWEGLWSLGICGAAPEAAALQQCTAFNALNAILQCSWQL